MIREIQIDNFKSIPSLNMELGRFNVLIGANGCGKSNILEAIAMGSAAAENKLDNPILFNRGIRLPNAPLMRSAFTDTKTKEAIGIKFITDQNTFILTLDNGNEFNSNWEINVELQKETLKEAVEDYIKNGKSEKNTKILLQKLTPKTSADIINFFIYAPENQLLRRFEDEEKGRVLGVRGEGLFPILQLIIQENPEKFKEIKAHLSLFDWFEDVEIPHDLFMSEKRLKITDAYLQDGLKTFDQKSANEGFLYLLFYLTLFISNYTPKFFAIDNIDNALNPKLGSELISILSKLAVKYDKQVILTTHNPAILDGLDLSDDEQRLFVISRNKSGHTKALRVPDKERNTRLSESFIRGYIGGLPKNF